MNDLRYAFRQLLKSPGLTFVVVASLAVGIGANAVVFTWIRATLLNAIPVAAQPEELTVLLPEHKSGGITDTMSLLDIEALAAERKVFAGITASQFGSVQIRLGENNEWLWGQSTSNPTNIPSRRTLQRAGFVPFAHILNGSIKLAGVHGDQSTGNEQ